MAITFKPRPLRRHNKCGIVERKNDTVKRILERLSQADRVSIYELFVSKANFISNYLYGDMVLSSFELEKGYSPPIVGNQTRIIPEDIIKAHICALGIPNKPHEGH